MKYKQKKSKKSYSIIGNEKEYKNEIIMVKKIIKIFKDINKKLTQD